MERSRRKKLLVMIISEIMTHWKNYCSATATDPKILMLLNSECREYEEA